MVHMVFKLVGGIIVLFSSGFLGYVLSRDCARRPQQLRDLQSLFQMLENQISFMSEILSDAFEIICRNSSSEAAAFFETAAGYLKNDRGIDARGAWERAVKDNIKSTALGREDIEILFSFGRMLGGSDLDGQVKNIRLTRSQLELQERKAEEFRTKNERMYRSLGILGGIAVVIIIL